jgi:hypothetical protein
MDKPLNRRAFLQCSTVGLGALWVGTMLPSWVKGDPAYAQVTPQTLNFTITDALRDETTNNAINISQCFFWIYKEATLPAETPGPLIFALEGDTINLSVTNALPQNHEFAIPGIGFTTGPIAPGATFTGVINVPAGSAGSYLYYDTLNAPVNRVMGLHGAFIVMPNPATGTPYTAADLAGAPNLASLFRDLGVKPWFPGLAWDESGNNGPKFPVTPAFRQIVWVLHEASPNLFADVERFSFANPGVDFPASTFVNRFLNNSFTPAGANDPPADAGDAPQFFTLSGQSGHFSHNFPFLCPFMRVGEPAVLRVLNAGLWTHPLHIHANHVYVLKVRNELTGFDQFNAFEDLNPNRVPGIKDNHIWVDTFSAYPMDVWEWLVPYIRPPDVPNSLGIGRPDLAQTLPVDPTPIPEFGIIKNPDGTVSPGNTPFGETTWPPVQEVNMAIPKAGTQLGGVPVHVQLSPMCYPMHDHSEPTQTVQGGNYNQGMISGLLFIGDRNAQRRLRVPNPGSGITVAGNGVFTFPVTPLTYNDPNFGNAADNVRAVYGPDFQKSPQTPAGPQPPFKESD